MAAQISSHLVLNHAHLISSCLADYNLVIFDNEMNLGVLLNPSYVSLDVGLSPRLQTMTFIYQKYFRAVIHNLTGNLHASSRTHSPILSALSRMKGSKIVCHRNNQILTYRMMGANKSLMTGQHHIAEYTAFNVLDFCEQTCLAVVIQFENAHPNCRIVLDAHCIRLLSQ